MLSSTFIDEAQNYALSALEDIRMLLGLNLPEQPAFALILVGDPYLLSTLRLRSHRALYSRIATHARIERLSRSEVEPYLEHHCAKSESNVAALNRLQSNF